jgi:hypothetical protein
MVGTGDLRQLFTATTAANAKTVLVGDAHQLAPVKARGGMFAQLCNGLPWTQRLTEVWRACVTPRNAPPPSPYATAGPPPCAAPSTGTANMTGCTPATKSPWPLGNQAALDFRAAVEQVPDFLDFDRMRPASAFIRRNLLGAALAIHVALPFSYSDEKVARVLAGSGRLNDMHDFERRLWETASGFLSVLDVDSLAPGGDSWEKWVRIRLMHSKVPLGVSRSGTWDYTNGGPISSLATAAGVYLFGEFRANLILGMGGRGTPAELAACIRTWQWVATILGSPPELIGRSIAEQRFLDVKIGTRVLAPGENSRILTRSALNGVSP